eukprot:gene14550-17198_t
MTWAQQVVSVETKLVSFVQYAIAKLDAAKESLEDEDPEDNYQELCTFTYGMSSHLKANATGASAELKGALTTGLLSVWNLATDQPGPDLRDGGVPGLHAALQALLEGDGALASHAEGAAKAEEEHAAAADSEAAHAAKPDNLSEMSIQDAVTYMWDELDKGNRLEWGADGFSLDLQSKGSYNANSDRCPDPLFTTVNGDHHFWKSRVTRAFISLLDNYTRETGTADKVGQTEKREMSEFLDALCSTPVIRFVFEFLRVHGKDPRCKKLRSVTDFQNLLFDLWMAPYRRYRANDSSGFEHVFVGEEKRGAITGFHNWLQFYLEEKKGKINYLGWSGKQDRDWSDDCNIVSVKFQWDDNDSEVEVKPISTILCGSTIEFEIGALTLCFLGGEQDGDNPLRLGNENVKVTCHSQRVSHGGNKIGTAFFELR